MGDPKTNPEAQYRQGFEHGAWELYRELMQFLPLQIANPVQEWLEHKIEPWRQEAYHAAVADKPLEEITPPHLRLKQSN
jgi:hypothetical protein